jgi:uncharacterized CHY-type Zn-finger protein
MNSSTVFVLTYHQDSDRLGPMPAVLGLDLDPKTRCVHYHSPLDIVAIKIKCCGLYYACKDCHIALAGHAIEVWPRSEWQQPAVLCGACKKELTIQAYLESNSHCPACGARFNPACANHHHFYFDAEEKTSSSLRIAPT